MNFVFYLLCAGILLYLAVYYSNSALVFLFLCLVLLPVGLSVLAGISAVCSKGRLWTTTPVWAPEDNTPLRISLCIRRGRCRLPLPGIRYRASITCSLQPGLTRRLLKGQEGDCILPWQPEGCGIYRLILSSGWGWDYLKLFPLFAPAERSALVLTVLPSVYPCRIAVPGSALSAQGEARHSDKKGSDYTEPFALRPYEPGDKLNRVHWKLSRKLDRLIVKEGSAPSGCGVVLFADMRRQGQALLEGLFSVSLGLSETGCPHYLCWYTGTALRRELVFGREALYALSKPLLEADRLNEQLLLPQLYDAYFPGEPRTVSLTVSDSLYLGEKQMLSPSEFPRGLSGLRLDL